MRALILAITLAFALPAAAQHYAAFTIPDSLTEGANVVVRDYNVDLDIRSGKKGYLKVEKTLTLLNEKSSANELVIYYDEGTRVRKIEIVLYDALGRELRVVDKDEVKDYSAVSGGTLYGDRRIKHVEVRHNTYPYTISYRYERELEGIDFAAGEEWYPQHFGYSVEAARFSFSAPIDFPVNYKGYRLPVEPTRSNAGNEWSCTWEVKHLKALPHEAYAPQAEELLPKVVCVPGRVSIEGYEGEFSSWAALSKYIHTLWEGRGVLPETVKSEIQQLVAGATSDEEKIARLYRYLQQNMRYVSVQLGIGGWQPFDAEYVTKNKYGDCKALTNYMWAMLREVGIEAYPALIRTGGAPVKLDTALVKSQFNHVLLYLPGQDNWLECTVPVGPPQYIYFGNHDRKVLLVKEEGGGLYHTPHLGYLDNIRSGKTSVQLSETGDARLSQRFQMAARDAERWRAMDAYYSETELKDAARENLLAAPGLLIEKLEVLPEPDKAACQVFLEGQSERFASKGGKRLFLPLLPVVAVGTAPPPCENRRWPIAIREGFTCRDTVSYQLPDGYEVESIMEETATLEHPTGYYQLKVDHQPGTITIVRVLQRKMAELPPAAYEEFRAFWLEVGKLERSMAVLVQKRT